MTKYLLRLDDASNKRSIRKWDKMEHLLDKYGIKPLVAVIPDCQDPDFMKYEEDVLFWEKVHHWQNKDWIIGMHGVNHVFVSQCAGINPVNNYSEFAGVPIETQMIKIEYGYNIFLKHGLEPHVFIAPAHTYDENTLLALKEKTNIRVISDTPANKIYSKGDFIFVPQQSGRVRWLPFETVTFCYHPNNMNDESYTELENFIKRHKFSEFPLDNNGAFLTPFDHLLMQIYYWRHKL